MVVAEIKPLAELTKMVGRFKRILILGCGDCVSVCLSGGKRQVELLASALRTAKRLEGNDAAIGEKTILRQCEPKFIEQISEEVSKYDAVISMACGAGVQGLAERFSGMPVLPAMNTRFIGVAGGEGDFLEMCSACGECVISETGGICPITRCPKGLMNGPCGGSKNGRCEASPDVPCAWLLIYEKMKGLGRLDDLKKIAGIKNWSRQRRPGRYQASEKAGGPVPEKPAPK